MISVVPVDYFEKCLKEVFSDFKRDFDKFFRQNAPRIYNENGFRVAL